MIFDDDDDDDDVVDGVDDDIDDDVVDDDVDKNGFQRKTALLPFNPRASLPEG